MDEIKENNYKGFFILIGALYMFSLKFRVRGIGNVLLKI